MKVYTAPEATRFTTVPSVFLAGSIEMGTAEPWQDSTIAKLADLDVEIYNPRRADWDSSWVQSITNPQFATQVNWEMDHLELADIAFFYFDPATKAPITLMELGFMLGSAIMFTEACIVVVCPKGFWRKGNVEVMCARAEAEGVHVFFEESLDEGIAILRKEIAAGV